MKDKISAEELNGNCSKHLLVDVKVSDNEKVLLDFIYQHKVINIWWMSDFYELFCKTYDFNFNDIFSNQSKMRYRLNKLVKLGLLEKRNTGSGFLR